MVEIINEVKDYIDIAHVSSGGLMQADIHVFPGYQIKLSETIKNECDIDTITVGLITQNRYD